MANQKAVMKGTDVKIGDILPNGSTVMDFNESFVLALTNKGEFATWGYVKHIGETLNTFWGHYFKPNELGLAVQDLSIRT